MCACVFDGVQCVVSISVTLVQLKLESSMNTIIYMYNTNSYLYRIVYMYLKLRHGLGSMQETVVFDEDHRI